jgi:hypothetical protein
MTPPTRLAERVPILGHLGGAITVIEPLTVTELGVGGVTIETRFKLLVNSLHELRLTLGATTIIAKGRVAHSHISDVDPGAVVYHSGLEFVDLPNHVFDVIVAHLEALKGARVG